jgi:hypothetical protein
VPLEQMADTAMSTVKRLGADTIKLPHAPGQICRGCLKQKVIVIAHQAI